MKHIFQGTGVALVTPFNSDQSVDILSLNKIVNHVIDNGVDYLVALGTTSESATLASAEKTKVLQTIIETSNNRVPVVVGMGGNNTSEIIGQLKHQNFDGISGILSVAPYYNKPTQDGIFSHFNAIAEISPVPIILYNVPGRTSVNMKAETTLRLAEKHANIVAIKEASGDLLQIMEIIKHKPSGFAVLSGDDALTLPSIALGAMGVISVVANALSSQFSDMVRLMLQNKTNDALVIHYKLLQMIHLLFADGNPAGIKALLNEMGLCEEILRLPLVPASEKTRTSIKTEYNKILNF